MKILPNRVDCVFKVVNPLLEIIHIKVRKSQMDFTLFSILPKPNENSLLILTLTLVQKSRKDYGSFFVKNETKVYFFCNFLTHFFGNYLFSITSESIQERFVIKSML